MCVYIFIAMSVYMCISKLGLYCISLKQTFSFHDCGSAHRTALNPTMPPPPLLPPRDTAGRTEEVHLPLQTHLTPSKPAASGRPKSSYGKVPPPTPESCNESVVCSLTRLVLAVSRDDAPKLLAALRGMKDGLDLVRGKVEALTRKVLISPPF
jgi:hypothetical protein